MKLQVLFSATVAAALAFAAEAAAKECQIKKKAELALGYSSGMMTVEAKINGTPLIFGIDTGAQTLISPETAADLRLARDWRRTLARGTTATTLVNHVMLRDFEFAGERYLWKSVAKIALPQPKTPGQAIQPKPIAGLLGMDILGDYDLDFDFPHRKLTLYDAKTCTAISPPGYTNTKVIAFKFNEQRNILLPIELNGIKLTALLDTGSTIHMVTPAGVKKTGITEEMLKADPSFDAAGVGNISQKHALHKFRTLTIGGLELTNVPAGVLNRALWQGEALLGQPIWLVRRFWVSSATRTLYLDDPPFRFATQTPGSTFFPGAATGYQKAPTMAEACRQYPELQKLGQCSAKLGYSIGNSPQPGSSPASVSPPAPAPATSTTATSQQASADPKPPVPELPRGQTFGFGFLGVGTSNISEACGKAMGLAGSGVVVEGFSNFSPGLNAGLRRADIIISLNGEPVPDANWFQGLHPKNAAGTDCQTHSLQTRRPSGHRS